MLNETSKFSTEIWRSSEGRCR